MPERYDIKGIIFDLDGVINHVSNISYKLENSNHNNPFPVKNNHILKIMDVIGTFLHSVISFDLPIVILTQENSNFISKLFESWPSLNKSSFISLFYIRNLLKDNCLDRKVTSIAKDIGISASNLMIIGDTSFYARLELKNSALKLRLVHFKHSMNHQFNFNAEKLSDVLKIVKKGILFGTGKLPNNFLSKLLKQYKFEDPDVIIGPYVGEDTAAVDIEKNEVLLLKSDPITFATDSIGYYSVLVNTNDMVTSGAMPRWMLTTLMFPPNTSVFEIQKVFDELYETCFNFGISICGGHTEITDAVSRPVVVGTVVGTIKHKDLIKKRGIRTGDIVLMTKGIAIEGTVIIASEFRKLLLAKGMSKSKINDCLKLKTKMSILEEAKLAWQNPGVTALHDVTEGGIITAISELSSASGCGIDVYLDDIFIYNQTQYLCDLIKINALGLIGSGSLLICCKNSTVESLISDIAKNNIRIKIIGRISEKGASLKTYKHGLPCQAPQFEVDEIARLTRLS